MYVSGRASLLLGRRADEAMTSPDPEFGRWEGQRGPGSGPGTALGLPSGGSVSFWVISTFNFSVFYEQGVNQDPMPTASCKGLINWRFMGQWQRKAAGRENGTRLGSQGAGAGSRTFLHWGVSAEGSFWDPCLLGLGIRVGWPGWAWALVCALYLGLNQAGSRLRGGNHPWVCIG